MGVSGRGVTLLLPLTSHLLPFGMPNHTPPQLFLVDGYALIYRAFFALITRPLRTSRGENTSAAWGVVNFLLRLQSKYRPDYLVWVLDAGDSFRTQRYAAVQVDPREARRRAAGGFRHRPGTDRRPPRGLPDSRARGAGIRGRRRDRHGGAAGGRGGPPGGDRLRRQGFLPAHRTRDLAAQSGAGRSRRSRRNVGRRGQRLGAAGCAAASGG